MKRYALLLSVIVVAISLGGCRKPTGPVVSGPPDKNYHRELPPGQLALRKITDPAQIPDFTQACRDTAGLQQAIRNSLNYLSKPSSMTFYPYGDITHAQAVASLRTMEALLTERRTPAEMNQRIRQLFDVYISVGCDDAGTVLYTGYYTPIFNASPTQTSQFRYPIYRAPQGLQKGPNGEILTAMPTRRQLETTPQGRQWLQGNELYYLADPFEVYIAHVQGSAVLRMPDGALVTVGYAANNGYEYKSIGQEMIREGKFKANQLSLQAMIDYFKAHPEEVSNYTYRNDRFVFFARSNDNTPRGSLNEPVTPWRSIATDKSIFPRACLAMLDTSLPRRLTTGIEVRPYQGFALDQDSGGAIRAPGRCDVYMGTGDDAGDLAGRTYQEGRLYYLFLKPQYMQGARNP